MTVRATPPFRADHVGSLLRPPALAEARGKWKAGEITLDDLRAVEDAEIARIVAQQERIGLHGVTDGEFRRDWWHLDYMFAFDGSGPSAETYSTTFDGIDFVAPAAVVSGRIAYPVDGIWREHVEFMLQATTETAKLTVPSPAMFRHRSGRKTISAEVYPEMDAFWDDLGVAYNAAMKDYGSLGLKYMQLDDVSSCLLCDDRVREGIKSQGDDPDQVLDDNIRVTNAVTAGRPADMCVTTHFCRGNYRSTHAAAGGYEAIAEKFLSQVDVDGFFMEYDDDRSGDFAPLRFLPKGKVVVLGVMTSKYPELESKDELKRRIGEAAEYVPLEQLCISPQCGFASTHEGNQLTEDQQWRKLERLVEVANEVWGG